MLPCNSIQAFGAKAKEELGLILMNGELGAQSFCSCTNKGWMYMGLADLDMTDSTQNCLDDFGLEIVK